MCSSGMPIAFGPWKRTTATKSRFEFAGAEGRVQFLLAVEHPRRRLDRVPLGRDRRGLDDRPSQRSFQHPQSARRLERVVRPAQHAAVAGLSRRGRPGDGAFGVETRFDRIIDEFAPDGLRVAMQQAGPEKLADQQAHAAGGVKMINVSFAVRVNPRQERRDFGEVREILPPQRDARCGGHRNQMDGKIGRAAGRVQPHDAVDDRAFVDDPPDRRELVAERGNRQRPLDAEHGERVAQRRVGIDERRSGQMQAHDLHQHLVGVGRAVEGAGAGRVIGLGLRGQQISAVRLAFSEELADFRFLVVAEARGHRSRGQEHRRQMAEGKGDDQEARHDLVADPEIDRGVEHVVRKGDRGRERNDIAREQGKLHSLLALGHPVAHRRNAASDLAVPPAARAACLMRSGKRA